MTKRPPRNMAASVGQRLLALTRARNEDYNLVIARYALERLLYRLSQSPHAERFVLKGAMLFTLWTGEAHRPTRDLDLLATGDNQIPAVEGVFREICTTPVEDDGLQFDPASVRGSLIREDEEYQGVRIELMAYLGSAKINVQVDAAFGDAVTPAPEQATYPTLLDLPAPMLKTYPRETVIAEKFHAMVNLGMINGRMKDFYDIATLAKRFTFDGATLSQAIRATFERRKTQLPSAMPVALTSKFSEAADVQAQWAAFLRRGRLRVPTGALAETTDLIAGLLMPPTIALIRGEPFTATWPPGGPWGQ